METRRRGNKREWRESRQTMEGERGRGREGDGRGRAVSFHPFFLTLSFHFVSAGGFDGSERQRCDGESRKERRRETEREREREREKERQRQREELINPQS